MASRKTETNQNSFRKVQTTELESTLEMRGKARRDSPVCVLLAPPGEYD